MQENGLEVPGSPLCPRVSEQRGSPLCLGLSRERFPHTKVHPSCAHGAAGEAEPALGSFPGMGFLGEVPAGKGCSLNRWGRPIAFLEGSSSDCPMWPPLKWALCLFQTFLYGHSQPWHTASSTAGEPTPARYWTGKLEWGCEMMLWPS